LELVDVHREPDGPLRLATGEEDIECFYRPAAGNTAVLWVFGAGGGLGGPAGGIYRRLGAELPASGTASLELAYRYPGYLLECLRDVTLGIDFLTTQGCERVVLVGHSFGGAVVIESGARHPQVIAVAALSSQSAGTYSVDRLTPKPLLVAHGTRDEVLPDLCSRDIYARAKEPKKLLLYPNCGHGLDACREKLDHDLRSWLLEVTQRDREPSRPLSA
jgi:pimeloyl-ACP methyl ester carboxylesterase